MSNSIKATALEPDPSFDGQHKGLLAGITQLIPVYGLPALTLGLILLF